MSQLVSDFIRLAPLKRVPTLVELENLLAWLSDCNEVCMLEKSQDLKQVLLPWLHGPTEHSFALGVSISKKLPDLRPIWTFYRKIEPEPEVEWAYASQDVSLIHNMLLCFFPDEMFAQHKTGDYARPPKLNGNNGDGEEVAKEEEEDGQPMLQGTIEKLQLDCLLQSLASSRVTGKLVIDAPGREGGIFFEEGIAVHSYLDGDEGPDAMLELLTFRSGDFNVFADERSPSRSITRRMEALLMESAALMDYELFLEEAGINESTVLEKIPMSYMEYLERMKDAPPLPEDLISAAAANLDRPSSIEEVAARLGLPRPKWLPVIYSFIKAGVVRVSPLHETVRASHQNLLLSRASVIDNGLLDVLTGLYSHQTFEFLLQLELTRAEVQNRRFAFILLVWPEKLDKLFLSEALPDYLRRIELLIRPADLVCRFESKGVALLLPDTSRSEAEALAWRLEESWSRGGRKKASGDSSQKLNIGVASYPDDGGSLRDMLKSALGQNG